MKTLEKVTRVLCEESVISKTLLSQRANVNYSRLSMCLEWMRRKRIVDVVESDGRSLVKITENGRMFAVTCFS